MPGELGLLVQSLERRDILSAEEQIALSSLPFRVRSFAKGESIVHAGAKPSEVSLLLAGMAVRSGVVRGKRQITAFQIQGNLLDLHALVVKEVDQDVDALTDCRVALIPHIALRQLMAGEAHLARLLWLGVLIDGAIEREWLKGLRRRSSLENLAHILCEMYVRLSSMDLTKNFQFSLPVTQEDLADVLGITTVHTNRTVQQLRRTGFVEWPDHLVRIDDFDRLAEMAEFDPAYLNLVRVSR